ncbi:MULTISPECIES: GtrA family protein [Clostridium]|jgi:putative flippase GtrA|uniref:GtrA family protein n=1 Tax=Clostridium TaxID=1485 RepID=UPI0005EB2605|nr:MULTISPECIES: GtrA family protein [Clostridium]MDU4853873.1 GtrA family protein [Clostridioides difficile]MDB2158900.1 GtrA family protein [Clostridium butyricum]MDU1403291.1 GtrA family protein [Clostridium sp.]MDU4752817.1 GtrA family protein [Clostridium butyricum]MDU4926841.1 GtrA family protein [Clostridium sp.]
MKNLINQIIKFGIVGVLAFLIDYVLLFVLVEYLGMYYLISSAISFTVSVVFNYICSMKFVFTRRDDISKKKEFIVFLILSIVGLLINQAMMWIMVDKLLIYYMISKIIVTGIVMIWNFISRKIFLEKK